MKATVNRQTKSLLIATRVSTRYRLFEVLSQCFNPIAGHTRHIKDVGASTQTLSHQRLSLLSDLFCSRLFTTIYFRDDKIELTETKQSKHVKVLERLWHRTVISGNDQ
ncbi:hypothetical protein OAV16_00485 [Luminiphilus sp.]|nr:hypothetical protein [Luminiphilus sp.]MDC3320296.1 hypothetical protein [Luminiphilus sp.]